MTDINEQIIDNILSDYNKFTKEEAEILNTFEVKNLAKYNKTKYKMIGNTEPRYVQSLIILGKFKDIALQHKQLILNTTMEHINTHKEILLQLLSILQSLVNNPNILDTLISFLDSEWYSGQDFKKFISNLINQEMEKLNTLYSQQLILTTQPLICFLPEVFNSQNMSIDTVDLSDYYQTLNTKYVLEP